MKNVVMSRIDDRLLHGQVVVAWIPYLQINEVLVIDEEISQDDFLKELMIATAPQNIKTNIMNLNDAIVYLNEQSTGEKLLILTKNISNIIEVLNNNIKIDRVNLGGLGFNSNRKRYLNFISLSNDEVDELKKLNDKINNNLEIQMVPSEKKYNLDEMLGK